MIRANTRVGKAQLNDVIAWAKSCARFAHAERDQQTILPTLQRNPKTESICLLPPQQLGGAPNRVGRQHCTLHVPLQRRGGIERKLRRHALPG
jgi:hypothetical protein